MAPGGIGIRRSGEYRDSGPRRRGIFESSVLGKGGIALGPNRSRTLSHRFNPIVETASQRFPPLAAALDVTRAKEWVGQWARWQPRTRIATRSTFRAANFDPKARRIPYSLRGTLCPGTSSAPHARLVPRDIPLGAVSSKPAAERRQAPKAAGYFLVRGRGPTCVPNLCTLRLCR